MEIGIGNPIGGVALSPAQTQVPKLEPQRKGHFLCLSYHAPWIGVNPCFPTQERWFTLVE